MNKQTKKTKQTEQTNNLTFTIIAETCDHLKVIYERRDFTLDEAKSALYTPVSCVS